MAASQAAKALRVGGVDVIDLGLTDPDSPMPNHIIDAAHFAAKAGRTLYTAAARTVEVREAIAGEFRHENGLDYTSDEIVVANGEARRDLVVDGIRKINGLTLAPPGSTFYAYIGCASLIGRRTPKGVGRVASVPGVAYGLSPYFRISTATGEEMLAEAIARINAPVAQVE
jgi:aspartate/methionine/tyrosine aminotransferase